MSINPLISGSNLETPGIYVPKIIAPDNWRARSYGMDRGSRYPHMHSVAFTRTALQDIKNNTPTLQVSYLEISALQRPIPVEQGLAARKSISNVAPYIEPTDIEPTDATKNKTKLEPKSPPSVSVKKEEEKRSFKPIIRFLRLVIGLGIEY